MRTMRKVGFAVLLLLLLVGAVTLLMAHSKEPDLMRIAQHLPYGPGDPGGRNAYYWLTDSELLYLSPMQKVGMNTVERINARTGEGDPLGQTQSESLCLSPNGRWALTVLPARGGDIYFIERTDGKRQLRYRRVAPQDPSEIAWTPDDKKMVELTVEGRGSAQLRVYPLDKPAVIVPVDMAPADAPTLLGVLPDNHAIAAELMRFYPDAPHNKTAKLYDFPIEDGTPLHTYTVLKPYDQNSQDIEATLSPHSDRIAWLFLNDHKPPFYNALRRVYNSIGVHSSTTEGIWLSKPDGSDMRALGSIPLKAGDAAPNNLRWTPSGDNLSFLYKSGLYLVPVH
jgi:hypothetical protein